MHTRAALTRIAEGLERQGISIIHKALLWLSVGFFVTAIGCAFALFGSLQWNKGFLKSDALAPLFVAFCVLMVLMIVSFVTHVRMVKHFPFLRP
jgi:FtsH-binding integral membrane protein